MACGLGAERKASHVRSHGRSCPSAADSSLLLLQWADTNSANDDTGFQVVINDTFTPSPTWVINSYIGYSRWHEAQNPVALGKADGSTVGLDPALFQASNALPTLNLDSNYTSLGAQPYNYNRYVRYTETAQANLTKQFSKHTLRFGAQLRYSSHQQRTIWNGLGRHRKLSDSV